MDALEFLRERNRMCKSFKVKDWAAAHPRKTRQSVFLEQYPETEIDKYGCLRLCPELVSADYRNRHRDCINRVCIDCRREFWMQEVE